MKAEIIRLLRGSEDYISGQELCKRFQVSRTAVWKVINQLKEDGYVIETVQNKGYRLLESPDIMEEYELTSRIRTAWAGRRISYKEETESTNIDCKQLAEQGAPHGTLAVADAQKSGRGRSGKSWSSPAGCSIFMSLLCRPAFSPDKASMLTLVMGLSVAEAIRRLTGLDAKIKWPNDIVVQGKKVCGILTEMELSVETNEIRYLVIGVGINVNNGFHEMQQEKDIGKAREKAFAEEIRDMATSLFLEQEELEKEKEGERQGKPEKWEEEQQIRSGRISRAVLIQYVMEAFERNYGLFVDRLNLSLLRERYHALLVNRDADVLVLDPKGKYQGIARGIDDMGCLLVETEKGDIKKVFSGEVSVRGLYGYAT